MKKFKVTVTETLSREVKVEAETLEDAISEVETQYYNEDIVLDAEDYVDTKYSGEEA